MNCRRNCVKPPRLKNGKRTASACRKPGRKCWRPRTDAIKPHLTDAPWVVVLFKQKKRQRDNGEWAPTYYTVESCGIAAGMFIQAVHNMGLETLTHTPSPMGFLRELLGRPKHEEAMLVMPVGYPAEGAEVPDIHRKSLDEVAVFFDEQLEERSRC